MAKATPDDISTLVEFFNELESVSPYSVNGPQELLVKWKSAVAPKWRRVVFGCALLIEQCADPDKDYLDYHPKFNFKEQ